MRDTTQYTIYNINLFYGIYQPILLIYGFIIIMTYEIYIHS